VGLVVRTDRRGLGAGRALMEAAVEHARAMGLRLLWLSTHEGTNADRFYERLGWTRVGVIPDWAVLPSGNTQALEIARDAVEATIAPSKAEAVRALLSADQRERLIERLAAGATNVELASEFGFSRKQAQGFRMGLARKGAKRRTGFEEKPQSTEEARSASTDEVGVTTAGLIEITGAAETRSASADEVVRYLRQRDDVVVWQGEGKYLVNGRFQLTLPELIDRANKMRNRQGKPGFKCENSYAAVSEGISPGAVSKLSSTIRLN